MRTINQQIALLSEKRDRMLSLTAHLSVLQYNYIPMGFNNNIIWNIGHLIAFSENLLYQQSSIDLPEHFLSLAQFNMGTKPVVNLNLEEITRIRVLYKQSLRIFFKELLITIDEQIDDFSELAYSERVIEFLLFHEDQHYQKVSALLAAIPSGD